MKGWEIINWLYVRVSVYVWRKFIAELLARQRGKKKNWPEVGVGSYPFKTLTTFITGYNLMLADPGGPAV
jgi:hypothetical protein